MPGQLFDDKYSENPDVCPFCGTRGIYISLKGSMMGGSDEVPGGCTACEGEWLDEYVRTTRKSRGRSQEVVYKKVMDIEKYRKLENILLGVACGNEDAIADARAFALIVMMENKEDQN